ncbi:hypothetical protein O181_001602 [Austropuccinia psidii MF-1]|uniref:Reverse transcriptase Ty1/copia-type domain-containing protein n=1 Tax=Austropuccinia psidii MF-1 TaxID=1389203 RepID=A0A9Q3BAX2_9BASI|nr:hypothetical protein [Austropuccinia psidii MF-1]
MSFHLLRRLSARALQKGITVLFWKRLVVYLIPEIFQATTGPRQSALQPACATSFPLPQDKTLALTPIPKHNREWKLSPSAEEVIFLDMKSTIQLIGFYGQGKQPEPLLINSFALKELFTIKEPSTSDLVMVDETHANQLVGSLLLENKPADVVDEFHQLENEEESPQENQENVQLRRLKLIGPRHSTLISCDLEASNGAINSVDKEESMNFISKELGSMSKLEVWDIVDLDPSFKLVRMTWVFRIKRDHLGNITEYKAGLCAQGFTQSAGVDFGQIYSPTRCLTSLRTLIAFASSKCLEFHQVDINSAFLNAPLAETVYLEIPQVLNINQRKHILRLKQALLAWYEILLTWIQTVDDISIFRNQVDGFKRELEQEFEIRYLGQADLFLGIKITHSNEFVSLDQRHFTESLLDLYAMSNCNPVSTPLIPNDHLEESSNSKAQEFQALKINYCSSIGCINYLRTETRTYISFSVSALSQFVEKPGICHWKDFLHVLKYLKGIQDLSLTYPKGINAGIIAYTDSNWGNCKTT